MEYVGRQNRESKQSKGHHSVQLWGQLDQANSSEAVSQITGPEHWSLKVCFLSPELP